MEKARAIAERVIANVEKVIIGKHDSVQRTLLALLCQGHLLIEDVPGTIFEETESHQKRFGGIGGVVGFEMSFENFAAVWSSETNRRNPSFAGRCYDCGDRLI